MWNVSVGGQRQYNRLFVQLFCFWKKYICFEEYDKNTGNELLFVKTSDIRSKFYFTWKNMNASLAKSEKKNYVIVLIL